MAVTLNAEGRRDRGAGSPSVSEGVLRGSPERKLGVLRWTTEEQVDYTIAKVIEAVKKLRLLSPLYDMHQEGIDINSIQWQAH